MSTPSGTTRIDDRCTPRLVRSVTSAELVASTAVALRPMAGSSLIRAADAPSALTTSVRSATLRSVTPRERNSCTIGMLRSRAAASAARPLVQRIACTTSGRSSCHWLRSGPLKAGTRSSSPASPELAVGVVARDRSGGDVLDPDACVELGPVGLIRQVLLGVYGHLVALPGELAGELVEPDVIVVKAGASAGVQGSGVLGYYGDLHQGPLASNLSHGVR